MTSNPLSTAAAEILATRGRWWEFELFAQHMIEGIDSHANSYQPRSRDPLVFMVDPGANLEAYVAWLTTKIANLAPLVEAFDKLLTEKAEWAFGATGEPGNAKNISHLASDAVRLYLKAEEVRLIIEVHEWKFSSETDGIVNTILNDMLFKTRAYVVREAARVCNFYGYYAVESLRRIRETRERSEKGEEVSLDLRMKLKIEPDEEGAIEKATVLLNRLTENIREQLSRQGPTDESADPAYLAGSQRGYLYILMNPTMPGLIKIGKTTRRPTDRTRELSAATGIPTPFVVIYELMVDDCHQAEKRVHETLDHYRVSASREFFKMATSDAIDVMHAVKLMVANS